MALFLKKAPKSAKARRVVEPRLKPRIYDSIAQCSAAEGIPSAVLKFSKRQGCPAFDHGRVNVRAFNEWFHSQAESGKNWDDRYKEFRAKREQQKFTREDGRTVSTDDAVSANAVCMGVLNRVLRQRFCNDLPSVTKGLDEIGIRKENEAAIERAFEESRKGFDAEIEKAKQSDEVHPVAA